MIASAQAFTEGLLAYNKGEYITANPHPSRYTTHIHWKNGWETGFDEDHPDPGIDEEEDEEV